MTPKDLQPPHHVHETAPLHDAPDSWHDHSADQKPQHAHAEVGNAGLVMGVGVVLFLVIVVAAIAIDAFYRGYAAKRLAQMETLAAAPTSPAIVARKEKHEALLYQQSSDPRWITIPGSGEVPARQFAQLPIAVATDLTVKDYARVINRPARPGTAGTEASESAKSTAAGQAEGATKP